MKRTLYALACVAPVALSAQTPGKAPPNASSNASAPASTSAPVSLPSTDTPRASWLSDRRPLHVGDVITVLVDEQTSASEQTTTNATANRNYNPQLNINPTGGLASSLIGPQKQLQTSVTNQSQEEGDAARQGNFTATLAVKVTSIDQLGNAHIEGTKDVTIDGRQQEVKITGLVRADDVNYDYQVSSTRIADAMISYKGKLIKPKMGIIGKILSILWP